MSLTRETYAIARSLPSEERFALGAQMRRAAVGVAANIAEGHASAYRGEFLRYLSIAHGSLTELECHLLIAVDVGHVNAEEIERALATGDEVSRMLRAMRRALGEEPTRRSTLTARRSVGQQTDRRNRSQS